MGDTKSIEATEKFIQCRMGTREYIRHLRAVTACLESFAQPVGSGVVPISEPSREDQNTL